MRFTRLLHSLTWLAVKRSDSDAVLRDGEEAPAEVVAEGDLHLDPLFEIPIELVRNAVGYRPDEPSRAFDGRFVILDAINPTLKQRLFGG